MGEVAIKVEGISKKYKLLHKNIAKSDSVMESASRWAKGLYREKDKVNSVEEFWALKDISFEINKGDRVGIIGRNGAGKSTLLKVLSRIVLPTAGRIEYTGRMASLLEVGTGFHGDLSGRENIYLNGSILGMSKHEIDRKFDEIVAFSEIEKFLDTPVKRYSSGMYVRLAFAVAAHLEQDILIVDEVLAVGDSAFQKKCLGKMQDVSESEGRTVLFVSHSISTIKKLCNKGILLKNGMLESEGVINEVVNSYENSISDMPYYGTQEFVYWSEKENDEIFYIKSIQLQSINNEAINYITTYDCLNIETQFYSPRDVSFGSINVFIKTTSDIVILRFGTSPDQGVDYPFKKGMNKVTLTIPKVPLPQGQYIVSVGLAVPMREWLLEKKDYFILNVEEKDIFNSGYHPIIDNSLAITDYFWQIH